MNQSIINQKKEPILTFIEKLKIAGIKTTNSTALIDSVIANKNTSWRLLLIDQIVSGSKENISFESEDNSLPINCLEQILLEFRFNQFQFYTFIININRPQLAFNDGI